MVRTLKLSYEECLKQGLQILLKSDCLSSEIRPFSESVGGKSTVMAQTDVNFSLLSIYICKGRSQALWTFLPSDFNIFRTSIAMS